MTESNDNPLSSTKGQVSEQPQSDSQKADGDEQDIASSSEEGGDLTELSADELESLIKKEDPNFAKSLNQISAEELKTDGELDLVNIDEALSEEASSQLTNKAKGLFRLKAIGKTVFKKIKNRIIIFFTSIKTTAQYFLLQSLPFYYKKTIELAKNALEYIKLKTKQFFALSIKLKLVSLFLLIGFFGTSYYIFLLLKKGGLLHFENKMFLTSFKEMSSSAIYFNPKEKLELESFYDSTRTIQHIISLPKNVVNIRPSQTSSNNPMFAFELYIKGNTAEVVLEIKDREYEVKDRVQRLTETMNFDQLDTIEGKQLLLEKLRKELNDFLTKGRVRKVYFKTVILKP